MLLRSSSTPILGSILSSESPNNFDRNRPPPSLDNHKKLSFHASHQSSHPFLCNSSPTSHSKVGFSETDREPNASSKGFRRAQSDGNLEALTALELDDLNNSNLVKSSKRHHAVLETIPSFSVYRSRYEDEEEVECGEDEELHCGDGLQRSVTIGENVSSKGGDFSFANNNALSFVQEVRVEGTEDILTFGGIGSSTLFLARGPGFDDSGLTFNGNSSGVGGGGDGSNFSPKGSNGGADGFDAEHYYKRMVEENPSSALVLRNYAHFLHMANDFRGAEEYYSRAILVEPGDGEILSQYAKLIWQFHHDGKRAGRYFEQAVQAAPDNSQVLAAYANFLWETEEDEEEQDEDDQSQSLLENSYGGNMAFATA
ncbi:uncharacterized protein [Aristolochia californica]|uniref:uncharacterized protein n=1 Tax=Aristolochia californica TaxID=171875 RepID=UPI0035D65DF5